MLPFGWSATHRDARTSTAVRHLRQIRMPARVDT